MEESPSDIENLVPLFQWQKVWYPVAVEDLLDPKKPHSLDLLGMKLVLWKDKRDQWHCFEDACPHRQAPLSEGRVEKDGNLLCSYHAWRFDGDGKCVSIPQCKDQTFHNQCLNQRQSSCKVFPTLVECNVVWVWGDCSETAIADSQKKSPFIPEELKEKRKDGTYYQPFTFRDLPYGWDYFIENVVDPAHVNVSHHNTAGSRYDIRYFEMQRRGKFSVEDGFCFEKKSEPSSSNLIAHSIRRYFPPVLVEIRDYFKDGGEMVLILYATPTKPGWCRHIGAQILKCNKNGKYPGGLGWFSKVPRWIGHMTSSMFLHQDLVLLHGQQYLVSQKGRHYYMPNPQDNAVAAFRRWMKQACSSTQGEIPWLSGSKELPPLMTNKNELFDVWNTHTVKCLLCKKAEMYVNFAYYLFSFLFLVCMMMMLMGDGSWMSLLGSFVFAGFAFVLGKADKMFYVYPFEHSEND